MTLFSIECATCQAKLNVRDPALIGQILACPKCSSMVMVDAPEGFQLPADADDEAEAPSEASSAEPSQEDDGRAHCDSRADTKPMAVPQPEELGGGPTARPIPAEWSSDESRQMRRLLVLSGAGVGAVVLAVALCGFWMARNRRVAGGEPTEDAATETAPNGQGGTHADNGAEKGNPQNSDPANGDPANGDPANGASDQTSDMGESGSTTGQPDTAGSGTTNQGDSNAEDVNAGDMNTGDGTASGVLPNNTGDATNTNTAGAGATGDGGATEPATGQDSPPGFDPTPGEEKEDIDTKAVAESLKRLEELLAPGSSDDEAETRIEIERRPTRELAEKPTARNVDIPVQLRRPVLSMKFENVPLIKFTRFISEMSTIPIAVDPVALRARGIRASEPVAVDLEDTNVDAILRAAIEPLGLTLKVEPTQVRIAIDPENAPNVFEITDLTEDNPQQVQHLSTWITTLIAPTSWTGAGGDATLAVEGKTLRIENEPRFRYEIRRLLERVRQSRMLPRKSDLPAKEIDLELADGSEFLAQSVTVNHRIPVYFTEILSELGESADVDILVDWQSAAKAGWNPEGKMRLRVDSVPLTEALDELLGPMELEYHVAGDRLLVVTAAKDERQPRPIYFHPCGTVMETLGGDETALSQLMTAKIGGRNFHPQGPVAAFYDGTSKQLVVAGPLKYHHRIAKLLKEIAGP